MRDFLHARLAPLTAIAQQVLAAAAVIGRSFDLATVTAASGRSDDETVTALEELLAQRLVLETGDGPARLLPRAIAPGCLRGPFPTAPPALAPPRGRCAGHAGAPQRQRRERCRRPRPSLRAGRRTTRRRPILPSWPASRRAASMPIGRRSATSSRRWRSARQTAALPTPTWATSTRCWANMAGHSKPMRTALTLCAADQRADLEQRLGRLYERLGDAARLAHHFAAAHDLLPTGATVTARPAPDRLEPDRRTQCRTLRRHRPGRSRGWQQPRQPAMPQPWRVPTPCWRSWRGARAICATALAAGEAGLAAARRQQDPGVLAAALNSLALVHADNGEPAAAIPLVQEALAQVVRMGDRHREAALRNTLADLHHACGRMAKAMEQLKQAVVIFAEIGSEVGADNAGIWMLREW